MVNLIVVTHGEFGAYLVEAAEEIVGRQGDGVRAVALSARLGMDEIRRRVAAAIEDLGGAEGLVIVTDMPGGTPSNVVLALVKGDPRVGVVSGVNLYMLVSAFNLRGRGASFEDILGRMLADGAKSIRDMKAVLGAAPAAAAAAGAPAGAPRGVQERR